jgi:hypothetical protein
MDNKENKMTNIYQRINAVRKAIGYVQKDKSVSTGGGSYRAVSHDQVTGMVRAALIEHGVIILPPSVISATFHQKEEGSKQRLYDATYKVEFVNMESPEDRFAVEINAHALDNGDKAPGKAMSYATKYAILKLFNIETGEDEESRYQQEEFDILSHVDSILASTDMDDLKKRYSISYKAAEETKNKDAMKAIIAAKDKAKKTLDSEMAGQA